MNILKIKPKKRKGNIIDLPDLYDFSYVRAARDAAEATGAAELPDLPNLSALRSAKRKITDDKYLPDLIDLAAKRGKSEETNKNSIIHKSRIMQSHIEKLKKHHSEHDVYGEITIDDYYSIFNDANEKSENKPKNIKSKTLIKDNPNLKYQSWSLLFILVACIFIAFAAFSEFREYSHNFEAVSVLAHHKNSSDAFVLDIVEYDPTQDKNISGRYNIRYINQLNERLPNGCEIVSLAMILSQFIQGIDPHEIIEKYLPIAPISIYNGVYMSQDPTDYYIGDPSGRGYGIFAPGLTVAADNVLKAYNLDREREAINISGCSERELFSYVEGGYPVIVWATLRMAPIQRNRFNWHLPSGQLYRYPGNLHCYVLVGVTEDEITLYDPIDGEVTYDRSLFLTIWREMGPYEGIGRQAVVVK